MTTGAVDTKEVALAALAVMSTEDEAAFARVIHPDATNRESVGEPPECRTCGPRAFLASARWLHSAFSDLRWEVHDSVAEGDLVVLHATMSGRQTGPFVGYDADARPKVVFPPTGRRFAVTQTHWFRVRDGLAVEHWANRDDRGLGEQLGWTPPSPAYLVTMLVATRRARRRAT